MDPVRLGVHRPPRACQLAVAGVEESLEIAGEPGVSPAHRETDSLPCQSGREMFRCEPYLEHRVAGLVLRLPHQPKLPGFGECAGLVPGLEQGARVAAAQFGRVVRSIPFDELGPLAAVGEPAQPLLPEAIAYGLPLVAGQEGLELRPLDMREIAAQSGELDVRKQGIVSERPRSLSHALWLLGGERSALTNAERTAGSAIAGRSAPRRASAVPVPTRLRTRARATSPRHPTRRVGAEFRNGGASGRP